MNCQIKIKSTGNDWENSHKGKGCLTQTENGFCVDYEYEGDTCHFAVEGNNAVQSRTGGINLQIHFLLNQQTQCTFSSSHGSGGFAVYTKKLVHTFQPQKATVELVYLSGSDKERVRLWLEAIPE
jgi:uncharacterized beta-barrel protein YwiB (DUF1934 family)